MLIKAEGADTQFAVGDSLVPLTGEQAVLSMPGNRTLMFTTRGGRARRSWRFISSRSGSKNFRPNWGASGAPDFFDKPAGAISPRIRRLAMDLAAVMMADPGANSTQEQLLSDLMIAVIERFTPWRAMARPAQGIAAETAPLRLAHPPRRAIDAARRRTSFTTSTRWRERPGCRGRISTGQFERSTRMTPHVYLNVLRMELAVNSVVHGERQSGRGQRRPRLQRAAPLHAFFPRSHRGQPEPIPQTSRGWGRRLPPELNKETFGKRLRPAHIVRPAGP